MILITVAALLLVSALEASASSLQRDSPGDAEIRVTRLVSSVETTLTILPHGPRGDLPISLVFRAAHEDRPRSDVPSELGLGLAISPLFTGAIDLDPPHVIFLVDERAEVAASIEGPLFGIGSGLFDKAPVVPFDAETLSRLEAATTIRGRVFDLEFALTPEQVHSIGEFAQRIRQRPK